MPPRRVVAVLGASVLVLTIIACGSDDSEIPREVAEAETVVSADYVVQSQTCPPGFSLAGDARDSASVNFTIFRAEASGSRFVGGTDGVNVECVADADGGAFPFTASLIEFTVASDGTLDGAATWNDSVGLSMNASFSGSAGMSLHEIDLELTAPNGDTLSEMSLASSCRDCDLTP